MSEKKELQVAALENGTVIDHIPSDKLFTVVSLLDLQHLDSNITIGNNFVSKKLGKKGIIKIANRFFTDEEINRLSVVAPNMKLNIIRHYEVVEKKQVLMPDELKGTDISEGMMEVGRQKAVRAGLGNRLTFEKQNCLSLSYPEARFDAITVAFGVRNFEDLDKGLSEMYRVLTPGGHLVILELSEPEWFPMKQLYGIYSRLIIPTVGKFFSKDKSAYHYLPQSIKAFPQGEIMRGIIKKAGFSKVEFKRLTLGICTLYFATK